MLGLNFETFPNVSKHASEKATLFPKLISKIGFTDYDIVKAITDEKNFRVWRQLIIGSIREFHFKKIATKNGIVLSPPKGFGRRENNKIDYVTNKGLRLQVKGLTKGISTPDLLGCETQCSHGRIPNRLYKTTDFDYIVIVVDPGTISSEVATIKKISSNEYNFVILPISQLPIHQKSIGWGCNYLKSSFHFRPEEVDYNQFQLLKKLKENS